MVLRVPDLERATRFLAHSDDPTIRLRLALLADPAADVARLRALIPESAPVAAALVSQHPDGSWGDHDRRLNRLLPTLWMVKTLHELGLATDSEQWRRGVEFLADVGHSDDGVFSISGRRDGVLSCYVGIVALLYLAGGFADYARYQMDWVLRHQEIKVSGEDRRDTAVAGWSPHLKEKYGGCMAETTCLVGLLRTARAMATSGRPEGAHFVATTRRAFLERKLMFSSRGNVIPLAVSPAKAETWLAPTFPLDWRVDLVEVVEFVARTGATDDRMQDAIERLADMQRDDGTWPLLRSYPPAGLRGLERPSARRSSPIATMRVVEALSALSR